MAEVVERNIEDTLSEFSHIRKAKLFTEDEIKDIIRRRRQHEYSLQKRNKRITDFDSYIATELGILKLIYMRRNKTSDYRFTDKIEKSIISRLVRLHRQVCYRFQSRVDVWMRFIWFNRQLGRHMSIVRLWDRVLQVHGRTDPRLWSSAASFHLNEGSSAQARGALSKLKTELRTLSKAKKRVAELEKSPSCATEGTALRLEKFQLSKLQAALGRSVRITWDRALLHGLREARRLLTQGLSFNDNSTFLLLELLKLEGAAADFFSKRVSLRKKQAAYEKSETMAVDDAEENEPDTKKTMKVGRQRRQNRNPAETDMKDAMAFMKEVTEDVDFVISGGTFKIVFSRILCTPDVSSGELQAALDIANTLSSFADSEAVEKMIQKLKEVRQAEKAFTEGVNQELREKMDKESSTAFLLESLSSRVSELRRLLDSSEEDGVESALTTWNTWYPNKSALLQVPDPSTAPQWVDLLATRLFIVAVSKMRGPKLMTLHEAGEPGDVLRRYNEWRVGHALRVTDARSLMDTLATSNWGSKSTEFWRLYIEFEQKYGDCSRLPALQWRAGKTLGQVALALFHANKTAKEYL